MSVTDALTITSAPDALTRYYNAKECEESAVRYIEDAYIESVNSLEKLEAENAKLMELVLDMAREHECCYIAWPATIIDRMRELGIEVCE